MRKNQILLVEDHPVAQKMAATILESLGCNVDVADDGKAALTKISNKTYDLIFMDIVLPDINGNEVTREIRKYEHSHSHHTPIVALTSNDSEEEKNKSLEAGMDDYCLKPLTPQAAQEVLDHYLKPLPNIDFELGKQLASGNIDLAKEMVDKLVRTLPDDLKRAEAAFKENNNREFEAAVYYILDKTSQCGVPRLKKATADLYRQLRMSADQEIIKKSFSELHCAVIKLLLDYWTHFLAPRLKAQWKKIQDNEMD